MTIIEALRKALQQLEAEGSTPRDITDDLALAISRLARKYPKVAEEKL